MVLVTLTPVEPSLAAAGSSGPETCSFSETFSGPEICTGPETFTGPESFSGPENSPWIVLEL